MKALIGNTVYLSTGERGQVSGVDSEGRTARVVTGPAMYHDVPVTSLQRVCGHCGGRYRVGQSCICFDNNGQ